MRHEEVWQLMDIKTLIRFLLFDRDAIVTVAKHPRSLVLGLIFVVSAGFAREYDGEYLLMEPWHLLIPIVASLIGCTCLVVLLKLLSARREFSVSFKEFLAVYWMTAPLAWVYAFPFERLLDPYGATQANLWMLFVVALWRVALTIRCVQVLTGMSTRFSAVPVLLFSTALALLGLWLVPGPIFMIMGGVRLTDSENLVLGIRLIVGLVCGGTILIWLGAFVVLTTIEKTISEWPLPTIHPKVSKGLWNLALTSILIWFAFLPWTQAEQANRFQAEKLIRNQQFEKVAELSRDKPLYQFPPHWDPPPRVGYGDYLPSAIHIAGELTEHEAADWLKERYSNKVLQLIGGSGVLDLQLRSDRDIRDLQKLVDDGGVPANVLEALVKSVPTSNEFPMEGRFNRDTALIELRESASKQLIKLRHSDGQ